MMDNILQQEDFQHATSFSCFLFKKKLFSQEKKYTYFCPQTNRYFKTCYFHLCESNYL